MILLCYLLLLFLIISGGIFAFYTLFVSSIDNLQREDRKIWHGTLMLIGTLCSGIGVMMFRLFIGFPTRDVKYYHLVFHTISAIFLLVGAFHVDDAVKDYEAFKNRSYIQELSSANLHIYSDVHVKVGRMTLMIFGLQYIFGCLLFTCFPIRVKLRISAAPLHDVFGLWIFLCEISAVVTGIYMMYDMSEGYRMLEYDILLEIRPVAYMNIIFILLFGAGMITLNAIICPYFDWELVGPM